MMVWLTFADMCHHAALIRTLLKRNVIFPHIGYACPFGMACKEVHFAFIENSPLHMKMIDEYIVIVFRL